MPTTRTRTCRRSLPSFCKHFYQKSGVFFKKTLFNNCCSLFVLAHLHYPRLKDQSTVDEINKKRADEFRQGARSLNQQEFPLATANWLSRLSFGWMTPLVRLGAKRALEDEDVWKVDFAARARCPQADRGCVWRAASARRCVCGRRAALSRRVGQPTEHGRSIGGGCATQRFWAAVLVRARRSNHTLTASRPGWPRCPNCSTTRRSLRVR